MLKLKVELHHIIRNLTDAKINEIQAKAIALEIKSAAEQLSGKKWLKINLDRLMFEVDSKLGKLRSELLKWNILIAFFQMILIFTVTF